MRADAQRLNQRQLVEREPRGGVNMVERRDKVLSHSPVLMHAEHPDVLAVVVVSGTAGSALAAIQVRFDGAPASRSQAPTVGRDLHHFRSTYVAHHPRISEECLPTVIGMKIGAAETHAVDSEKRLARTCDRWGGLSRDKAARPFECDLLHEDVLDSEVVENLAEYRRVSTMRRPFSRICARKSATVGAT